MIAEHYKWLCYWSQELVTCLRAVERGEHVVLNEQHAVRCAHLVWGHAMKILKWKKERGWNTSTR